ncbi:18 kDa heat shock protein [bacterium BMS3Abin04]|nr:18 kDa heat shock protein [bacterium BMS3Abin04]
MTANKEMVKVDHNKNWEKALENESWVAPLVDIYETDDEYYLVGYVPGVKKEDVKIKFEDDSLVIMGKINYEEEINKNYILKETETGNYYRKFRIGDAVDAAKIEAHLEDGKLLVHLPKVERVKPKTIKIK